MAQQRSLTARLTLAMVGVAVLGSLLAGLLTAPLLASATRAAVRDPLGRQAELLAHLQPAVLRSQQVDQLTTQSGLVVGYLDTDGTPRGVATALRPLDRLRLERGDDVSTTVRYDGTTYLVEGRPGARGGAVVVATNAHVAGQVRARLLRRVLVALVVGLGVALAVGFVLAGRIGRSLTGTAAAARRLAAGERGVPLPESTTTEVSDVTAALAGLDHALATSEARQRSFLLSVSHELRTPLTTMRGYAEGLADGVIGPEEMQTVGRTLVAEAQRMERYVADLLALARLEADDFSLHPEAVDLRELLASVAATWRERGARDGITVELQAGAAPYVVTTDGARLRQTLEILLDNATRVCSPGDRVVLALSSVAGHARVEVRDSGPGLTPEDAAVAFEPGALHDRYAASRPVGHGLGLAIAYRLVTRLGGTIAVQAAPEGGAAFVVDLPSGRPVSGG